MPQATAQWHQYDHKAAQISDDIFIHYVDVGPRDATPLVLVHGWPDLWFGWRHQIGPLSQKYRVIAVDLRGFGESSTPTEISSYGSKNVTGDLARLLNVLKIDKAVFIGHDWGGSMVWRMCLYHPTRVLAACSVCTPYFPPDQEYVDLDAYVKAVPQFKYYMKLLADTEMTAELLDRNRRRLFSALYRHHYELGADLSVYDTISNLANSDDPEYTVRSSLLSEEELDMYVATYGKSGFRSTINYYATRAIDFETEKDLPAVIEHDALFIGARNDPILKPELAVNMPKHMTNLEMASIDDAGHWILWEQPQQVTETILQWLAKLRDVVESII